MTEEIYSTEHLSPTGEVSISSYIRHLQSVMERWGDLPIVVDVPDPHVPLGTFFTTMQYNNDGSYIRSGEGSSVLVIDVV